MNNFRSWIFKICIIAGLVLSAQFSFADTPVQIPIPPDGTSGDIKPKPYSLVLCSASATISETQLVVYFDFPVEDATITVYDADNNVVYQETVNTTSIYEVVIPVVNWDTGDYMITVSYGSITQRGYFNL